MCSPHTQGVDCPSPLSGVFHTISSGDHSTGRLSSVEWPSPVGPRHMDQSGSAERNEAEPRAKTPNAIAAKNRVGFSMEPLIKANAKSGRENVSVIYHIKLNSLAANVPCGRICGYHLSLSDETLLKGAS